MSKVVVQWKGHDKTTDEELLSVKVVRKGKPMIVALDDSIQFKFEDKIIKVNVGDYLVLENDIFSIYTKEEYENEPINKR